MRRLVTILHSRPVSAVRGLLDVFLHHLGLSRKLMLVYTAVLAIIVAVFAGQLIAGAARATERSFIADTRRLVKDARIEIERNIEICERSINVIGSDYDLVEYVRIWNDDRTDIFDFRLDIERKFDLIQRLGPELHQFRVFVTRESFPEIGSSLYHISRIENCDRLIADPALREGGVWRLNHPEEHYNLLITADRSVVSLYKAFRYPVGSIIVVTEASMLSEKFFSPLYAQPDQEHYLPFAIDRDGGLLYDRRSVFIRRTGIGAADLRDAALPLRGRTGDGTIRIDRLGMNLVYDYIPAIGVHLGYLVSNEKVLADLRATRNVIVVESLLALALLGFVISFITEMMLRKMKLIVASMRKVQDGALDTRVTISGSDEVGELAYHFNMMLHRIEELISVVVKKQEAVKNAEIRALFTQINSHFIINVLENIRMMAELDGSFQIADSIVSLGKLMRYGLSWTKEYVRLEEEIAYIRSYIDLVNMRYEHAVRLEVKIPEQHRCREILKLSLQPVIENAVYHGLEPTGRGGLLRIEGFVEGRFFVIAVTDDGVGMAPECLERTRRNMRSELPLETQEKRGHGIGLRNVYERIRLFYGPEYGLEVESVQGEYTRVRILLPYP
jgi:two-component system sensor histidine kinase YesM